MTDKVASPDGSVLSEGLGPLPPHRHCRNSGAFEPLYTAVQMRAYATAQVAEEHERWNTILSGARRIAENNAKRADDCGMLSRALLDALNVLRA